MKPSTRNVLIELIDVLTVSGFQKEASDIEGFMRQLESPSAQDRESAANSIAARCHIKSYGDLNLNVRRTGKYPDLELLSEVKAALASERNSSEL